MILIKLLVILLPDFLIKRGSLEEISFTESLITWDALLVGIILSDLLNRYGSLKEPIGPELFRTKGS